MKFRKEENIEKLGKKYNVKYSRLNTILHTFTTL